MKHYRRRVWYTWAVIILHVPGQHNGEVWIELHRSEGCGLCSLAYAVEAGSPGGPFRFWRD